MSIGAQISKEVLANRKSTLQRRYGSEATTIHSIFPKYNMDDIYLALERSGGNLEAAVDLLDRGLLLII